MPQAEVTLDVIRRFPKLRRGISGQGFRTMSRNFVELAMSAKGIMPNLRRQQLPYIQLKEPIKFGHEDGDEFEGILKKMLELRETALINIEKAQEKQKLYYDAKHCKDVAKYSIGAKVLLRNNKKDSRKGSKLEPTFFLKHLNK